MVSGARRKPRDEGCFDAATARREPPVISMLITPLHKTDSDLRKADIATVAVSIPLICILRNSAVHGTQQCGRHRRTVACTAHSSTLKRPNEQ